MLFRPRRGVSFRQIMDYKPWSKDDSSRTGFWRAVWYCLRDKGIFLPAPK